jgi:indolepyruvate ferredoxin oxidoreductase
LELASLPDKIRGFGHIKQRNVETARACEIELLGLLRSNDVSASAA